MKIKRYISLGAGVQSTVLTLMVDKGCFGKPGETAPDLAIFADTKGEPPEVYDHLDWLESELTQVEVVRTDNGRSLEDDVLNGVNWQGRALGAGQIPIFSLDAKGKGGLKRRECTDNYKIKPIEKVARARFGQPSKLRLHIESWLGISTDEIFRAKDDRRISWIKRFPLIDLGYSREKCLAWFAKRYPDRQLPRSACFFCPFHSQAEWVALSEENPALYQRAVAMDKTIRRQPPIPKDLTRYLHRRKLPLERAVELDKRAIAGAQAQMSLPSDWLNECEGVCGV